MSQDPQNETAGEEQWMVAIAPGNVQMMDVEQLDAAYQAGQINDSTMVWTQGMDAWLPLAQVIGGEEASGVAAEPAPAPALAHPEPMHGLQHAQVEHNQQVIQQQVDATTRAWQQQADAASAAAFGAAHGLTAGAGANPVAAQHAPAAQQLGGYGGPAPQPNFAPVTASGFPPVAGPGHFHGSYPAPVSHFPPASAPKAPPVPSTVPVAMNLESLDLGSLDMDMPKKKSKLGLFAAAALVLGAGGVTAMNLGGGNSADKPAVAAAAAVAEDGAKPIAKNDPNAPLNLGNGGYAVTEAEKQAFAKEADKDREMRDKMAAALTGPNGEKADTSGKGASAPSAKANAAAMKAKFGGGGGKKESSSGSGVSKGGSSFDPLNGDL